MDRDTERYLAAAEMPEYLKKKLFKKEGSMDDVNEKLRLAEKDHRHLNKRQREKIRCIIRLNESQGLNEPKVVLDKEVAKEVEKWQEGYIRHGIETGKIKRFDPEKDRQAAYFMRKAKAKRDGKI